MLPFVAGAQLPCQAPKKGDYREGFEERKSAFKQEPTKWYCPVRLTRLLYPKRRRDGAELYPTDTKVGTELGSVGSVPGGVEGGLRTVRRGHHPILGSLA